MVLIVSLRMCQSNLGGNRFLIFAKQRQVLVSLNKANTSLCFEVTNCTKDHNFDFLLLHHLSLSTLAVQPFLIIQRKISLNVVARTIDEYIFGIHEHLLFIVIYSNNSIIFVWFKKKFVSHLVCI